MAESGTPYQLDPDQVLRAANALVKAIQKSKDKIEESKEEKKPSLFDVEGAEEDESAPTSIWLVFTAKTSILDSNRLKPGKIKIPHPVMTETESRICLITADPPAGRPDAYKELVHSPAFPEDIRKKIAKVTSLSKVKAKYKSFESKRQFNAEYDIFLADERIITLLPGPLGKVFYKSTTKRPIPVSLTGKLNFAGQGRPDKNKLAAKKSRSQKDGGSDKIGAAADVAAEIKKTLKTTLIHLAPSTTTSVKAGYATWTPSDVAENIQAIVDKTVEQYIPKKWRGVKSIHVKTPTSAALPIWLADELWAGEEQILNSEETPASKFDRTKKRKAGEDQKEPAMKKSKLLPSSKKAIAA